MRRHLIQNKEKRKRVAHFVAGITILTHAYENYEVGHPSYKVFAIASILVLLLAAFHTKIEKKLPWIDGVFFVIEGILSILVAVELFSFGKRALPIPYLLLGIFQFIIAFRKGRKGMMEHNSKSFE